MSLKEAMRGRFMNELREVHLAFEENILGKWVATFVKPENYITGYSMLKCGDDYVAIQSKYDDNPWDFSKEYFDSFTIEEFDDCLIITAPRKEYIYKDVKLVYRFDTELDNAWDGLF